MIKIEPHEDPHQEDDKIKAIINVFRTRELSYYQEMMHSVPDEGKKITVILFADECAAILQAYDYGVENITSDAAQYLDDAIKKLKEEIWSKG